MARVLAVMVGLWLFAGVFNYGRAASGASRAWTPAVDFQQVKPCDSVFSPAKTTAEVQALLEEQRGDWNRGDIEGFMKGYWRSDQLTFFSGTQEIIGWQAARDRYLKRYGSSAQSMGQLTFSEMVITPLGRDSASCWGKWELKFGDGKSAGGRFTLVLRRFAEGWRIIHDHTC